MDIAIRVYRNIYYRKGFEMLKVEGIETGISGYRKLQPEVKGRAISRGHKNNTKCLAKYLLLEVVEKVVPSRRRTCLYSANIF